MSDQCNHDCSNCEESCNSRQRKPTDLHENPHSMSRIDHVIGIMSGKGGVGKSLVTSMLAVKMQKLGYHAAILDADITGPSIPKIFGIQSRVTGNDFGILPVRSKSGIDIMSINLILNDSTDPVLWRGPIIAGTVKQFWTDVIWENVDYMFIDMPPGTGDVALTVFQSVKMDGIIIVTSPQDLVSMVVSKAIKMAEMMNIPILGLIENLSYFKCPDNGKEYKIFGDSHIEQIAENYGIDILAKVPVDPAISEACDRGAIETLEEDWLEPAVERISKREKVNGNGRA
ncbi:MAG TPA: Mrp/NBP35 family ATP-binding protein [Flexilinea sp.]|nr:Mrp/NBP35 family ATP-binding protein [Flexilinea sp.]HPS47507.1 Mrp/NBP35 family ATP-binding protein [Flexilinea sp.]